MTEPSPADLPRSKASAATTETQKRKKNSRKKSDAKSSNIHVEHVEPKLVQENKPDGMTDVINYINRLEHDVAIAKKQLKNQRKNFRKAISALAQHFDSQGISSDIITDYIKSLGKREAQVEELDESYEKFYTGYKYQIVQDPKNPTPQAKPVSKKSPELTTTSENNNHNQTSIDLDIPKLTAEGESLEKPPENTEKKKKKSTAKAQPTNGEANPEEAPKKRKYQKKAKPAEEEEKKAGTSTPDIQEIPSFAPSGKDSAKKSTSRHNEDSLRSIEEIPQLENNQGQRRADPFEGMRGYFNQLGMDPMNIMNMYMPNLNLGNMGMNMNMNVDGEYWNTMIQDMIKSSYMNADQNQNRQDVFNHYHQRNLK